jgi:hypothetical protein
MNLSALDEIVLSADPERCVEFFVSMPEAQRKTFAARALQWASALNGCKHRAQRQYIARVDKSIQNDIEFYENIQSDRVIFPKDFTEASSLSARAAVLASCNFAEIKRAKATGLPDAKTSASILLARKPSWTNSWCAFVLKEFPATHWLAVYELEKAALCSAERDADYWMSMVCAIPGIENAFESILAADETVRNSIWQMLADQAVLRMLAEPESISHEIFRKRWRSGGNIFGPVIKGRKGSDYWRETLVKLASNGLLDQQKLIDFSFSALTTEAEKEAKKSTYASTSSADFAIKLNQTLVGQEWAAHATRITALLGAAHKDVSTYASTVLAAMPSAELNASEICSCIAPAFLNKNKEPADAALKLLARLAKYTPSETNEFGRALLAAFSHSSKDIHKKALALVESTNILEDEQLRREFSQRADVLAGIERATAVKLLAKYKKQNATAYDAVHDADSQSGSKDNLNEATRLQKVTGVSARLEELVAHVNTLDTQLCKLACVDEVIRLAREAQVYESAVRLDSLEFPRLNPATAIKPIESLDDVIYAYMKVWGSKATVTELELVLDGVSRLCRERPSDFDQKIDVLRQKARSVVAQEFVNFGWSSSMAHLVFCWVGETSPFTGPAIGSDTGSFYMRRCLAVAKRAAARVSAPLLATPTHAGGWIDPQVLVKRLLEYFWLKIEPDNVDFIQALLRLSPDGRLAALDQAANLKGELGEALRFALGADNQARMVTPEYWVAALRARAPKDTSTELQTAFPGLGPDGAEAAAYGFNSEPVRLFAEERYSSISHGLPDFIPLINSAIPDCSIKRCTSQVCAISHGDFARHNQFMVCRKSNNDLVAQS